MDSLTDKYGLDVRVADLELTDAQFEVIDEVLGEMQTLRPEDFVTIERITFMGGFRKRHGAVTRFATNEIAIVGPFAKPVRSRPSHFADYNVDMAEVWADPDAADYLRAVLIHEMGHLAFIHSAHTYYEGLFPGRLNSHESFAEDYRLFVMSAGGMVMAQRGGGRDVPNYEERLQAMTDFMIGS